ncbi:hypothetical protein [Parasphingorhabdus pacifica]
MRLLAPPLTMSSTGEVCRPCYLATASPEMYPGESWSAQHALRGDLRSSR